MPHNLTQPEEIEHVLMIMTGDGMDAPDSAQPDGAAMDVERDKVAPTETERSERDGYIHKSAHGLPDP